MKPLTANLKTLYQCRYIWVFHFIVVVGILIMMAIITKCAPADFPPMSASLLLIFLYGGAICFLAVNILSKPFGFCLPGQIKTARKMLFLIWLMMTIIYSLVVAVLFFKGIKCDYALFFGSIGLISLSYWAGVTILLPKGIFIALLSFQFLIFTTLFSSISGIKIIEPMLMTHPWATALMSSILSYLIYRAAGHRGNVRRLCFILEHIRMYQDQRTHRVTELTGNFFSERIRSQHNSMLSTNLWAQAYLMIGHFITQWRQILLSSLLAWILIGLLLFLLLRDPLMGPDLFMIQLIFFIVASVIFSIIFNYHRFNIFLLVDRKEYLLRGIIILFAAILIAFSFMAASFLLFNLLSCGLLPIVFLGKSFVIRPISWILLIVPIIMLPLFGGLAILFRKIILIVSITVMLVIAVAISCYAIIIMRNTPFIFDLLIVLSATVITWGFHLAALYYHSMKRSLC